ncbi:MAG: protein kinase [Myxococcota bacterium]
MPEYRLPSDSGRIGHYDVVKKISAGGMGDIYLARQSGPAEFSRPVALKVIRPQLADDEQYRRMFLDEARLTAMMTHPNVVRVYDFGESDSTLYIAMEYLDGESLAAALRRQAKSKRPLPIDLSAHIVAEISAALHAAHNVRTTEGRLLQLVHRDISPSNIFLTFEGTIKLLDFGVARAEERLADTLGAPIGKVAYMSPEQLRSDAVDLRSDIFSLGIVLFELCAQRSLFRRPTHAATVHTLLNEEIPPPSRFADHVPPQYDLIALKCLARNPDYRYQSALELRRDLLDLLQVLGVGGGTPEERLTGSLRELFPERAQAPLLDVRRPSVAAAPALDEDTHPETIAASPPARSEPPPLPAPSVALDATIPTPSAARESSLEVQGSPAEGTADESFLVSSRVLQPYFSSRPRRIALLIVLILVPLAVLGLLRMQLLRSTEARPPQPARPASPLAPRATSEVAEPTPETATDSEPTVAAKPEPRSEDGEETSPAPSPRLATPKTRPRRPSSRASRRSTPPPAMPETSSTVRRYRPF